jgi:predicted AlkP superfamily pyrophosphatase or phosphodiesterase
VNPRRLLAWVVAATLVAAGCAPQPVVPASPERPAAAIRATSASGGSNAAAHLDAPHVVLVGFDGFRADYFERFSPPNFARAIQQGARAAGLIPVFPSKTFPNHYSIATGLYPEHHGLVANGFYDPERRESYGFWEQDKVVDASWYRGEPIWVTAETQGMVSACYFWPGSEAPIKGVRPTYFHRYDGQVPNEARVDAVLDWLRMPAERRPRLITLYFSDVDTAGHRHGPTAPGTGEAVLAVDRMLGRLMDGLDSLPHRDRIYLLLVSDHGMTETGGEYVTLLEDLIDLKDITVGDAGPHANLHVGGGEARARQVRDQINAGLRHGRAYLRAEVPARLHYREDPRIGDVVIVMDEHYMVAVRRPGRDPYSTAAGMHGWDPALPSMHGIFVAVGPDIAAGTRIPAFESVDVYSLMAELLGLTPASPLDGANGRLRRMLLSSTVP